MTTSADLILSIDAGTQSVRAALIDVRGHIVDLVKTQIEPYVSPHPGWAELNADDYYQALCKTCQTLLSGPDRSLRRIVGVTLATQRMTFVNVDANGDPIRPAIVWLDQRKADATKILPTIAVPFLKVARLHKFVTFAVGYCRSNWIRQNQPDIWNRTHKFLALSGFLTHRLTGEFADSSGNLMGTIPFDVKTQSWAKKWDFKWKLFPVEAEKLPNVVRPGQVMGQITVGAAHQTGIPAGTPFIAASNDKACEVIGAGCLTPETACISFGTTATINTQTRKYVELLSMMPPYPSAIAGEYCTEVGVMRGFWMISWFKQEFGIQEALQAQQRGVSPEDLLDQLIVNVPAGSMGLVLQPYWTPGPDVASFAKGSIIGFGDIHTRAHLYRAIVEGIIFALKDGAELTQRKTGVPIVAIRASGGGSKSDAVMQITADIFGLPVTRPQTSETSALGAAIDAAVGLGYYPDIPVAVAAMCRTGRVFEPNAENHRLYTKLYEQVYKKIYKQLLPLFQDIQQITGYPAMSSPHSDQQETEIP